MSMVESNSMKILIQSVANNRCISYEAAEDLIEHIQELLYEHRSGMHDYTSEEEILSDFGINPGLLWVFD